MLITADKGYYSSKEIKKCIEDGMKALFKKLCKAIKENDLTQIREEIAEYILQFGVNLGYFLERFLFLQNISKKIRYL